MGRVEEVFGQRHVAFVDDGLAETVLKLRAEHVADEERGHGEIRKAHQEGDHADEQGHPHVEHVAAGQVHAEQGADDDDAEQDR